MAEYFTLDPAYEHYIVGQSKLALRTVYNEIALSRFSSGNFVLVACGLGFAFVLLIVRRATKNAIDDLFLLAFGLLTLWFSIELIRKWTEHQQTRRNLEVLQRAGVLIDGTLVSCAVNTKPAYWRGDTPRKYLRVTYEFTTPDQERLYGAQIRMLEEKVQSSGPAMPVRFDPTLKYVFEEPVCAPKGTPIRVLYADPETYVML